MSNKGFTLIELLIVVVIIGILAAIAIPKFANSKEKAILTSMKTDLRNLVTAQEAFYFDNSDYAGSATAGAQVNALGGAGKITFLPSTGNVLALTYVSNTGYKAVMSNPVLVAGLLNCGVYVGAAGNAPNAAVTQEGAPACW
ncbi:MAG: prepilin-type N-terminal cleavage/methylation domain-containing protein [Gemmatimonadetes bacterium]|nr:prepilin-type N-terminal cleavage/methylation domain-containing protein [Gemmatimonadota bacterium]MBK7348713.1 prepilin-type N-terminal cleavage/methylation domain-containing protein [Gemmatimonadota bacterium]MBK7714277.1 prepilin-type N-terminal cleavage/methylation domain-containing protein [Gemmatimonadota bacterium]MBK7783341.1 prepilin-type N-terminal cleavage/methylation domain-containing protein [Gemmatimonadota bacterium]MBK7924281.1 prepilin-type N-terminal cleavage/methylation do